MKRFYVYKISDPTGKHKPYYGKGSGNRYKQHWWNSVNNKTCENFKLTKMLKYLERIGLEPNYRIIFRTNLEQAAYQCEEFCTMYHGLENLSNLQHGGLGGTKGFKHTTKTKHKMSVSKKKMYENPKARQVTSKAMKGLNNGMYGKKHSKESLTQMSSVKRREQNPFYGRKHSDETKRKMSEGMKRYHEMRRKETCQKIQRLET
jgi:hypothetical protein